MTSEDREGPLVSMDVKDFILTVGSRSATLAGGQVAALAGLFGKSTVTRGISAQELADITPPI